MGWNELYAEDNQPDLSDIKRFIKSEAYDELCAFLENKYKVTPMVVYSGCSAQPGWNIKYKKGGKSLCTLYPMDGWFIALVVIGAKEEMSTELTIPTCTEYVRNLFEKTPFSCGGRWLMINVTDKDICNDVKKLVAIRSGVKK